MEELYVCSKCGGRILPDADGKSGTCEYCGRRIILPRRGILQMNRADQLRRQKDFDTAQVVYRNLAGIIPDESEVWWNIFLCEYGIEYVKEKDRLIPTVNRMKTESVFSDEALQKALETADEEQKVRYQRDAQEIEDILKRLNELVSREKPYDVFISYKDKEENGDRTEDSRIAQMIYNRLTENGYRVFFSRITLRTAIGEEFEPKIFAALQSAPVMIVVACSKEHVMADWVKNEWSRYIRMMERGGKHLLPVYAFMKPAELPRELSRVQAVPYNGPESVDGIEESVENILKPRRKAAEETQVPAEADEGDAAAAECTRRAEELLDQGKSREADEMYDEALSYSLESAVAWWGKLRVASADFSAPDYQQDPRCRKYREMAMQYASDEEKAFFEQTEADGRRMVFRREGGRCAEELKKITGDYRKLDIAAEEKQQIQQLLQEASDDYHQGGDDAASLEIRNQVSRYYGRIRHYPKMEEDYQKIEQKTQNLADALQQASDALGSFQKEPRKILQGILLFGLSFSLCSYLSQEAEGLTLLGFAPFVIFLVVRGKARKRNKAQYEALAVSVVEAQHACAERYQQLPSVYDGLKKQYPDLAEVDLVLPESVDERMKYWETELWLDARNQSGS